MGKAVVLDFLDAAVAGGISHEPLEHQPNAGLALAALANATMSIIFCPLVLGIRR